MPDRDWIAVGVSDDYEISVLRGWGFDFRASHKSNCQLLKMTCVDCCAVVGCGWMGGGVEVVEVVEVILLGKGERRGVVGSG